MDFTREPVIETVITPREGCKLVVRSSKSAGQEEYFVDALEVVSFGSALFYRSLERPKAFLVPTTDYEVLEVREARMVLKNVGADRKIKIAGGRESPPPIQKPKEQPQQREEPRDDGRMDKRRDKRRSSRRRRGRREDGSEEMGGETNESIDIQAPEGAFEEVRTTTSIVSSLLPPPATLISETIQRYKQDDFYKDAFFEERKPPAPISEQQPIEQPVPSAPEEPKE